MNPMMIRASVSRVGYRTNYPPLRLTWGDRHHRLCIVLISSIALFVVLFMISIGSFMFYAIITPKEELKENIREILHEE